MIRTLEQQIAEAEARLARLRTQSRQLENGQKIILGGMLLAASREIDRKRLQPLLEELKAMGDGKAAAVVDNGQG